MRENKHWSAMMGSPEFVDVEGLRKRATELPMVESVIPLHPEGNEAEGVRFIRNRDTKELYGHVSDRYRVVQDIDLVMPLIDAVEDMGLTPKGFIRTGARTNGFLLFEEDKTKAEVTPGDILGFGIRFYNGKDGSLGFGMEGLAVRFVCTNGLISGDILGKVSARHFKDRRSAMLMFEGVVRKTLQGMDDYLRYGRAAAETHVKTDDALELIIGSGVPRMIAENIVAEMSVLVPELMTDKLTGWTLHNAITAYASHNEMGMEKFQQYSGYANNLLRVEEYDERIEKGREVIMIQEQRRRKE